MDQRFLELCGGILVLAVALVLVVRRQHTDPHRSECWTGNVYLWQIHWEGKASNSIGRLCAKTHKSEYKNWKR